ncbi:Uncharacterised protein [BD1-7 clade bacterium]|uniref:Uncharacterized protein n=1 Tax=BD1-7 clade bacterium TaxID=2029982 RepID=A0A5S9P6N4_9GAMM|nr:Uncharacterised protein [BD1-7 clade bacterium]
MTDDLFRPPESSPPSPPQVEMTSWKAITLALLLDIIATIAISVIAGVAYAVVLASQGMSEDQLAHALSNISPTGLFSLTVGGIGLMISVYAGYFCTLKNKTDARKNNVILMALLAIFCLYAGDENQGIGVNIGLTLLSLLAVYIGHILALRKAATSPTQG